MTDVYSVPIAIFPRVNHLEVKYVHYISLEAFCTVIYMVISSCIVLKYVIVLQIFVIAYVSMYN